MAAAVFAGAAIVAAGGRAGAQPPVHPPQFAIEGGLWAPPASAVVWYAAASADAPAVRVVDAVLVGALRSEEAGSGGWAAGAERLLALSSGFGGSRRIGLVELAGGAAGQGDGVRRLGVVMEVRGGGEEVAALLRGAEALAGGAVREVGLPDGRAAAGSGEWSWWGGDGRGLVGYGPGALAAWLEENGAGEASEWGEHNRVAGGEGDGDRVAAVFADVNRLRRLMPESAGDGGLARMLEAWNVENARALGGHVREGGEGVEIGVTWSARSRPPGVVGGGVAASLREGEGLGGGGVEVELAAPGWPRVIDAALGAKRATLSRWGRVEFDARLEMWMRRHAAAVGRTLAALGDASLALKEGEDGEAAGWPTIVLPLRDAGELGAVRDEVRAMLAAVRGATETEGVWRVPVARAGNGVGLPEAVFVGIVGGEAPAVVVGWRADRVEELVGEEEERGEGEGREH